MFGALSYSILYLERLSVDIQSDDTISLKVPYVVCIFSTKIKIRLINTHVLRLHPSNRVGLQRWCRSISICNIETVNL